MIAFLKAILPKVLTNIIVGGDFFPKTLLKSNNKKIEEEEIDVLYSNQILENTVRLCENYKQLVDLLFELIFSYNN